MENFAEGSVPVAVAAKVYGKEGRIVGKSRDHCRMAPNWKGDAAWKVNYKD